MVAFALVGGAVVAAPAGARVLVDRERALSQAFPGASIRTRTVYLDSTSVRRAEQAAGAKLATPRVTRYEASRGDTLLGTAYLDTHRVRTMNETVMIVVAASGRVKSVETLAFAEPDDYLAPRRWLSTFEDKALTKDLRPGGVIPSLGGSTLTARAIAAAVRRTLALHGVIAESDRRQGVGSAK